LYKRGGVYWSYFYADGIRYQKSTGTGDRRQAKDIDRQYQDEENAKAHGLADSHPDLTFAALSARFIADGSPKHHHKDRLKHLLPFFGDVPIGKISKGLVENYRKQRYQGGSVSPATVNRDVSVLRRIMYWAVEQGLLAANPLTRVKMERERRTRRPVMNVGEEEKLLAVAAPHLRPLVIAALDTGMRRGELLNQRFDDVDFERNLLYVSKSKTPEGEAREIPLTARVRELLKASTKQTGVVFTYKGQPIHSLKHTWQTALKKAGLRHFRFHDLRHTCATRLLECGVIQEVRMALLGHSNHEKVHSIYAHVELPLKRAAIAKLEQWHKEQQQKLKEESDATSQADRTAAK
jgi:integrase